MVGFMGAEGVACRALNDSTIILRYPKNLSGTKSVQRRATTTPVGIFFVAKGNRFSCRGHRRCLPLATKLVASGIDMPTDNVRYRLPLASVADGNVIVAEVNKGVLLPMAKVARGNDDSIGAFGNEVMHSFGALLPLATTTHATPTRTHHTTTPCDALSRCVHCSMVTRSRNPHLPLHLRCAYTYVVHAPPTTHRSHLGAHHDEHHPHPRTHRPHRHDRTHHP
jgi:hypothetical protein